MSGKEYTSQYHSAYTAFLILTTYHRHLKPGGWFELQEFHYTAACDDSSCDGPYAWRDFCGYLGQGMANLGSEMNAILKSEDELRAAGFQNIRNKNFKCPLGPWAKKKNLQECGHVLRDVVMYGLNGLARRPFRDGLGWTPIQIEMFLVDVRKHVVEEKNGIPVFHSYFPFRSICGQKPMPPV